MRYASPETITCASSRPSPRRIGRRRRPPTRCRGCRAPCGSYSVANTHADRGRARGDTGTTCGDAVQPYRREIARPAPSARNSASAPDSGARSNAHSSLRRGGLIADLLDDLGVRERRDVAERVAARDVAQQPAHDLPGARLRQVRREDDLVGLRDRADHLRNVLAELLRASPRRPRSPVFSVTNATIPSPLMSCGLDTTAASATFWSSTSARLDLEGRQPVTRHVHHVVDAAEQPEVAVLVAARAVARHVDLGPVARRSRSRT